MTDLTELPPFNVDVLPVDAIRPYWRNPRKIPEDAVDAVRESIQRFGYQNPIIVDREHVIITGHTRYSVLRQIGVDRVPVIVSDLPPERAKEYRLIDNRTQEFTSWDKDLLVMELREWESDLLTEFFPHIDVSDADAKGITRVTYKDLERAQERAENAPQDQPSAMEVVEVVCPHCWKSFTMSPPEV